MAFETRETKNISPVAAMIAPAMLRWYDGNARVLPWRVGPKTGKKARRSVARPDPFHVWLSEIMLQQTTVATVTPRYAEFLIRWPTVQSMAAAPLDDILGQWAGLGYYARARNLHNCAVAISRDHGGNFPDTEEALRELPGIGDYTAAAIAAIAFDRLAIVVDGNIERVVSRLFAIELPLPAAKTEIKTRAREIWPKSRNGDFAQSLMDLGAGICKPKTPLCELCPVLINCAAYAVGRTDDFPKKAPKKARSKRVGAVFALKNSRGDILFERRPEKGLLGGMQGLPGTPWAESLDSEAISDAPTRARWRQKGKVTHIFTHFHLTLDVFVAHAPKGFRRAADQLWIAPKNARLPSVMKKAVELAQREQGNK